MNKTHIKFFTLIFLINLLLVAGTSNIVSSGNSQSDNSIEETDKSNSENLNNSNNGEDLESLKMPNDEPPTEAPDLPDPKLLAKYGEYKIITLLPFDAIPAINNPKFLSPSEADSEYDPLELVIGVVFNGEARAYSINFLSRHEIVNDDVGGKKIAITW